MARHKRKKNEILFLAMMIGVVILFGNILSNKQDILDITSAILLIIVVFVVIFGAIWYLRRKKHAKIRAALLAAGTSNPMQLSPEQYEQFCAVLLQNSGWNASLTKKTGDFGADILAEKNGQKIVVQCKQWSKSVGIKAVQEAHTALSHYRAHIAIVVTTTGYTSAARELAQNAGVRLLSHVDLLDI